MPAFATSFWDVQIMLRFRLRDLLWLTLAVGLVIGWWLDHKRLGNRQEATVAELVRAHNELWKCNREIESHERVERHMGVVIKELTSMFQRKSKLWNIDEVQDAIAKAIIEADDKANRGLR
jgi:hypothetical protein